MKKTTITFLLSGFLVGSGVKAQTVQEGMNHLYADRFKSAIAIFEKLLATNPNNIDATYWLGQTYLDMDENVKAEQIYDKALQSSANAPLILVGKGHVDLLNSRKEDARQRFESAITMTRTKKGDDPVILTAIGRANVDAKSGDLAYAIDKLEAAVLRDPRNTETLLQLGNAYRKANPGAGGGKAYENYKKALEVNPNFAIASLRLAKIFETQKNWEFVLQFLNDATRQDPRFAAAYYELFYYYFFHELNFNEAENQLKKYIDSRQPYSYVEDQYLYAQLCSVRKDFNCAITKAQTVLTEKGIHTKPKVLKLLADAYYQNGDYVMAKKYSDEYFIREKPEGFIAFDYKLKADILAKLGTGCEELYGVYIAGAAFDTVLQDKIDYLTIAADSFKARNCKKQEADMRLTIYKTRTRPQPGGLMNIGILYSQAGDLAKADSLFKVYAAIMPDSIYGYYWRGRVNFTIDTTMLVEPFATDMVQNYQKALDIATTDKVRFKSQGTTAALVLAGYFNNIKSDRASAMTYVLKGLEFDTANVQLKSIRDFFIKTPATKQPAPKGNSNPQKPDGTKAIAKKQTAIIPKSTARTVVKK